MGTATFVKHTGVKNDMVVQQSLYRLDPPLRAHSWDDDEEVPAYEYVVVSAANVIFSGPETYIFGANEKGEVVDWAELPGSYKGGLSIADALMDVGYALKGK